MMTAVASSSMETSSTSVCRLQGCWLVWVPGRKAATFRLLPLAQLRFAARSRTALHHGI